MKGVDFFKKFAAQAKADGAEITALLAIPQLADLEIPDAVVAKLEAGLLTRERAENDPDIINKITKKTRSEVFDNVDGRLKKILPLLDGFDAKEIDETFETYKKLELLETAFRKKIDAAKKTTPDTKELETKIKTIESEWSEKVRLAKEEGAKAVEAKANEIIQIQIDGILKSKLGAFTFADEFATLRPTIQETIIKDLKGKNLLVLGQDGNLAIQYKDADGVLRDKFNGNDKVTIEKLLEEPVQPFLKRNNADPDQKKKQEEQQRQQSQQQKVSDNPTVAEMRRVNAGNRSVAVTATI